MFNIKKIKKQDYTLLRSISLKLVDKYPYLVRQVSTNFILDKKHNEFERHGVYTLILNAKLEQEFINKSLPQLFIIKDILVWNKKENRYEPIELDIMEGMLAGYSLKANVRELDLSRIDVSRVKEQTFENHEQEELANIIGDVDDKIRSYLSLESSFKIIIPEGTFYVIKDLGDGDYISIDKLGRVYEMTHDPYEVKCIYKKKEDYFDSIKNNGI